MCFGFHDETDGAVWSIKNDLAETLVMALPVTELQHPPPPIDPLVYIDPKSLARIFDKSYDSVKRWEQNGWIKATRKSSGRIRGYSAREVVRIAVRLFSHFRNARFDESEARKHRVFELLHWVARSIQESEKYTSNNGDFEVPLDIIYLASLSNCTEPVPEVFHVSSSDLERQRGTAIEELRRRLCCAEGRAVLLKAWRQAGLVAELRLNDSTRGK